MGIRSTSNNFDNVFATVSPIRSDPINPGPAVYEMKFIFFSFSPDSFKTFSKSGIIFKLWSLAAISGTTPPYSLNKSTCECKELAISPLSSE